MGIIGWPVEQSLSPAIHNAAFEALGLDWVYVPLPVRPGHLPAALGALRPLGFSGANVTMPHKTAVAQRIEELSEDARTLQAVNTIVIRPPRPEPRAAPPAAGEPVPAEGSEANQTLGLEGHNTDAAGFERFLREDAGFDPAGRRAIVYGGGGAARACVLALARGGLAALAVAVRAPERAGPLLQVAAPFDTQLTLVPLAEAAGFDADLVVNATPIGADGLAIPPQPAYRPGMLVVDLLYHPVITPLQERAKFAGATALGGLGMLLHQGALSFELWTGRQPPLDVMSAAALAQLADHG